MNRRLRKEYIESYKTIIFTQILPSKNFVSCYWTQVYEDDQPQGKWIATYITSSAYHICPMDGSFRNCRDCGAFEPDFTIDYCYSKLQEIDTKELISRIVDCERAGVKVEYFD